MGSLALGLVAALAWGIHDICVRYVSQGGGIIPALTAVLFFGCLISFPISTIAWMNEAPSTSALGLAALSGFFFGIAGIALYKAFEIGPVRLVAPIIGAYPVLSVGWAVFNGAEISNLQWLAVLVIIVGVGYVASSSDQEESTGSRKQAIIWSLIAGPGFALTFAIGQMAAEQGNEIALVSITRVAALVTVISIGLALKVAWKYARKDLWLLGLMGLLDSIALGSVIFSASLENPEFAAVAASVFGLITVILATIFLKEPMKIAQWIAVTIVFGAIAYLGA